MPVGIIAFIGIGHSHEGTAVNNKVSAIVFVVCAVAAGIADLDNRALAGKGTALKDQF